MKNWLEFGWFLGIFKKVYEILGYNGRIGIINPLQKQQVADFEH